MIEGQLVWAAAGAKWGGVQILMVVVGSEEAFIILRAFIILIMTNCAGRNTSQRYDPPDLNALTSVFISYKHKTSQTSEISRNLIHFLDVCRRCASWFQTTSSICQPGWRGGTSSSWVWLNWRRSTKITKVKRRCDCDRERGHISCLEEAINPS